MIEKNLCIGKPFMDPMLYFTRDSKDAYKRTVHCTQSHAFFDLFWPCSYSLILISNYVGLLCPILTFVTNFGSGLSFLLLWETPKFSLQFSVTKFAYKLWSSFLPWLDWSIENFAQLSFLLQHQTRHLNLSWLPNADVAIL